MTLYAIMTSPHGPYLSGLSAGVEEEEGLLLWGLMQHWLPCTVIMVSLPSSRSKGEQHEFRVQSKQPCAKEQQCAKEQTLC